MNIKHRNGALRIMLFVALVGSQTFVNAGLMDSSKDSAERAHGLDSGKAAKEREQQRVRVVHDKVRLESAVDSVRDTQLTDYLEMHGRVIEGSIRSTMMPWSALQQVAN